MNKLEILAKALEYMEQHLQEDIKTEDVAEACYCSKASLEKMFRCINRISVHDYLIRRRMMLAAKTIISVPGVNLLEVAVACGYSTNESFSRAFKSVWNCNPSEFRANPQYYELFPRLYPPDREGDVYSIQNIDISELYELFKERKNCYFICFDVKNLTAINRISHKAGDLVILETLKRLEREAGEKDAVFRIGGDEFAVLTNSEDIRYAEELSGRVEACNGIPVSFEDKEIPLHLHTAVTKLSLKTVRYNDLFEQLHSVIGQIRSKVNYDREADTMSISKAWDWKQENNNPVWRKPCEESYYIAERWKARQQKDILDFGCGLGRHSIYFAKQGFSVSAFDLSEAGVSSLREWAKEEKVNVHTTVCDMLSLPYADNRFDGIFAYNVISHTDTNGMKTILAEIKRILKPGGEIFLSLCSKETWAFKDSGYPKLDDNTVVVTDDGPEKGIPHFCVTLEDIEGLFHEFTLISVRHVDDCYFQGRKCCDSRRYFILASNEPSQRREHGGGIRLNTSSTLSG